MGNTMMTKKDYVKFAELIAREYVKQHTLKNRDSSNCKYSCHIRQIDSIKNRIIALFESDNLDFDADGFNAYIDKRVKELTER